MHAGTQLLQDEQQACDGRAGSKKTAVDGIISAQAKQPLLASLLSGASPPLLQLLPLAHRRARGETVVADFCCCTAVLAPTSNQYRPGTLLQVLFVKPGLSRSTDLS